MSASELGAVLTDRGSARFTVWAPQARLVELVLECESPRALPLERDARGYHHGETKAGAGMLYRYRLDETLLRPDPASRWQPQGVHGPSAVVDPGFAWTDRHWRGIRLADYVFYELHVGTFTEEGTFDAVIPHLGRLADLGVTAVELMPVAQFPGARNWGYDGVCPFAAQDSYGGPAGLKRLVDAAHAQGLAVVLDVVYNHLGPEGNYLRDFGPYFTDRYHTPWGAALNFDGRHSDDVRRFFVENALYWVTECHVDALRLDAVHAILDASPYPFLRELADHVHRRARELDRRIHLIAESAANDRRLVRRPPHEGIGLDAQWADDFHHAVHVNFTGEQEGYYVDYGGLAQIQKVLAEGYVYTGQRSPFREHRHGTPTVGLSGRRFVIAIQNHDQAGNRMLGERLSQLIDHESLKLAAALMLLSPYLPLIFMGEEYGEVAPFLYFVSHSDPGLIEAVRRGRREEFASFAWRGEAPDPQNEATFQSSKLDPGLAEGGNHAALLGFYRELLRLRRTLPPLRTRSRRSLRVTRSDAHQTVTLHRWRRGHSVIAGFYFGRQAGEVPLDLPAGSWRLVLDSAQPGWGGPGSTIPKTVEGGRAIVATVAPRSVTVFESQRERQP